MSKPGASITLQGMDDAVKQIERIERASENMGKYRGYVFSRMPYAWGIEYGEHRKSKRLARRAGGVEYLTGAVADVMSGADMDLSEGLTKVTAPGKWVIKRLGLWARRIARASVPVDSGRLRRSIKVEVRKAE